MNERSFYQETRGPATISRKRERSIENADGAEGATKPWVRVAVAIGAGRGRMRIADAGADPQWFGLWRAPLHRVGRSGADLRPAPDRQLRPWQPVHARRLCGLQRRGDGRLLGRHTGRGAEAHI